MRLAVVASPETDFVDPVPASPMADKTPSGSLGDFIAAYDAGFAIHQGASLQEWLLRWPDPTTRGAVLRDLLHVEVERTGWSLEWLRKRLNEFAPYIPSAGERQHLVREICRNAQECGESVTWNDLSLFGWSPAELDVRLADDPFTVGQEVAARYQIQERLGSGRFGVVYRANELQSGKAVALKTVLRTEDIPSDVVRELLREEAELLREIAASGVPQFYDWNDDPTTPFLVMEFISGRTLRRLMRGSTWESDRAVTFVRRLAELLHPIHLKKLIHRDIKPENILVLESGEPFLTDFGLALTEKVQFSSSLPRRGGTRRYMAPEAILGLDQQLDARTDIWSMGIILYELLTGDSLVDHRSKEDALVSAIMIDMVELPRQDTLTPPIQDILYRCLGRDRERRFDSAAALADALRRVELEPDAVPIPSREEQLWAWRIGRHLGIAFQNLAAFHKFLQKAQETLDSSGDPSLCRNDVSWAVGHINYLTIQYKSIEEIGVALGIAVEPFPDEVFYKNLLYRSKQHAKAETIAELQARDPLVTQVLAQLKQAIRKNLVSKGGTPAALFDAACRVSLVLLSGETWESISTDFLCAELPEFTWRSFADQLNSSRGPDDVERELARLDREVERWLQAEAAAP